ncbi:MAG: glycosyl transferase [Deltaproteobacteria bacterium]|nr:glycosyl transferase [Deltaproteobacteria bacterium]
MPNKNTSVASRPVLLFYCQHSLGMGHLVRSLALATTLAERFRVVFLNGGPFPKGITAPDTIETISLPPLGMTTDGHLVSRDRRRTVERAQSLRRKLMLDAFHALRPQVVFIELFPFGRKKFTNELLPLLEETRSASIRPLVLCSLRDILVGRDAQGDHDERASVLANQYFDAILVHADPQFARLEESFHPKTPLQIPVHYTGFVFTEKQPAQTRPLKRAHQIVVSAGGGIVGEPLLRTAAEAHALVCPHERVPMKLIAGPFLSEADWQSLRNIVKGQPGLSLHRSVPDLCAAMRGATASISQCGYNTALDILRADVPALVVPFAEGGEDEQMNRARRLEKLGALRVLDPQHLDALTLAEEIRALPRFTPQAVTLDLDGAQHTAHLVEELVQAQLSQQRSDLRETSPQ